MSEYVPSVDEAREVCVRGEGRLMSHAEFDCMIANVQAETLEEAANHGLAAFIQSSGGAVWARGRHLVSQDWLLARATELRNKEAGR